jgi:hypothetical protein
MYRILLLLPLLAAADDSVPAPGEIRLTIARDPYSSSDHVTLCRVRAVNEGSRSWPGASLRFEARAVDSAPVVRQRGRFGLVLAPGGSLETLVTLPGRHDRLEVELLRAKPKDAAARKPHKRKRSSR